MFLFKDILRLMLGSQVEAWCKSNPARPTGDGHRHTQEIPVNDHTPLLTREEVGLEIYGEISELLERGYSQTLGRNHALQVAAWALKIAGERELQHQVLAELVELPENLG